MEEEIELLTDEELDAFSSEDSYKTYIKDIKQYKVLSIEEQKAIASHYLKYKDQKSRNILINSNLRLVVSVAWKYYRYIKHLDILDIIQEGNMGLIRALETYNPEESAFSNYATYWIKQSISRGIATKEKAIRKPIHLEEIIRKYNNLLQEYEKMSKPSPSDLEICDILGITEMTLENIRTSLNQKVVSLNAPVSEEGDTFLEEYIPDDNNEIEKVIDKLYDYDLCVVIKEILSPREYYVIYKRLISSKHLKLEQIASLLKLTRERVRQIQIKGLKKIRALMIGSQIKYDKELKEIKEREGLYYEYLNIEPIIPELIIHYYYIKNNLTKLEDTLYRLKYFGKYQIRNYALYLGLTEEEYTNLNKSLNEKMQIFDQEEYLRHQDQMIKLYGKEIFDLITREDLVNDSIILERCLKSS